MPSDLRTREIRLRCLPAHIAAALEQQARALGLPTALHAQSLLSQAVLAKHRELGLPWDPGGTVVGLTRDSHGTLAGQRGVGGVSLPAGEKMLNSQEDAGQTTVPDTSVTGPALLTKGGSARETDNGKKPLTVPRKYDAIREHLAIVLGEVQAGTRARLNAQEVRDVQAELVFAYWQARHHHEAALLDDKRLNRLRARLRENAGDVHQLLYVVDGALKERNLMGENERNRKYDGIKTLFRDREQVEGLAELGGWKPGKLHPMAERLAGAT